MIRKHCLGSIDGKIDSPAKGHGKHCQPPHRDHLLIELPMQALSSFFAHQSILDMTSASSLRLRRSMALLFAVWLVWLVLPSLAWAQPKAAEIGAREVTLEMQFWVDETGQVTLEQLSQMPAGSFKLMEKHRSFSLQNQSALWMRLDLPAMDTSKRWYLQLSSGTFIDSASLFHRSTSGNWTEQVAGDSLPVAQWTHPSQTPLFQLDVQNAATVWIRLKNYPAPIAPRVQLVNEGALAQQQSWTYLLLGGYFGFGLLVLFLGLIHVRLYADRAFVAYSVYVAFMLSFQVSFTGIGGLFFWPESATWNNASPAIFMLLLSATGTWFVREACGVARHNKFIDKAVMVKVAFGVIFAAFYTLFPNHKTFITLNLYGLLTVVLGMILCVWTWRRGERYGGWLFLGFVPIWIGYTFPALRSAGLIADNWLSQYAVLIGSAIEIPLLLYVLHMRTKEFSENRARMRAIDHTDPLTGLAIAPVLTLRLRDAMRRSRRQEKAPVLILVELANHADIIETDGRPIGDRALVVAASRLLSSVSELDTVCRIDDARFAILSENSMDFYGVRMLAQRIIAKGLTEPADARSEKPLRFRVVTSVLQHDSKKPNAGQDIDLQDILIPLVQAMNELAKEPKKMIVHLASSVAPDETSGEPA
jgi:two-component system, sensor histidine kinase LadS